MNLGLSDNLKSAFPNVIPAKIPLYNLNNELEAYWITGFMSAEANFFISLYEQEVNIRRAGYSLSLSFSVSQHIKDKKLLERLARYFNCGIVRAANNRNSAEWIVTRFEDLRLKIIPFLNQYQLSVAPPTKGFDLEGFKKVISLMINKVHLTKEGFAEFKAIKNQMYKG